MGRMLKIVMLAGVLAASLLSFSGIVAQTPVPTLTPLAEAGLAVISADNAAQLKQLGSFDESKFYGFSPDSQLLFYVDLNRTPQEWDISGGKSVLSIPITGSYGVLSADDKTLASLTADSLQTWDMTTGKMTNEVKFENIPDGAYLNEAGLYGQYFIVPDSKGHNYVAWDTTTGKQLFSLPFLGKSSGNVIFTPDGKSAALYELDGGLQFVDLASGKVLWSAHSDNLNGGHVSFSPDGKTLAIAGSYASFDLLDSASGKSLGSAPGDSTGAISTLKTAFSSDGTMFILKTTDGVTAYDLTGKAQPAGTVQAIPSASSPDGKLEVVISPDVQIVEVASGKMVDDIPPDPNQPFFNASFSPDGKLLVLDNGGTIALWGVSP